MVLGSVTRLLLVNCMFGNSLCVCLCLGRALGACGAEDLYCVWLGMCVLGMCGSVFLVMCGSVFLSEVADNCKLEGGRGRVKS